MIKLFIELKYHFELFNIKPNQKNIFNITNVLALFSFAYSFCAILGYMIYEDNSIFELGNLFYGSTSYILNILTLSSILIKRAKIYQFIDKLETVIENSELQFQNMHILYFKMQCFTCRAK